MAVTRWIENNQAPNNPFSATKALDTSEGAQADLMNRAREQERMSKLSPEDQEKSHTIEEKLHTLIKSQDIVQLNQILRDPALKWYISDQLQREISAELRSISMDKVRGHIRIGNMGGVTEEMAGRLTEVKKGYGDIYQRLAEELNKPDVLAEDKATIAQLQDEVQEAETMVENLLANINNMVSSPRSSPDATPLPRNEIPEETKI